ncbi:MAG TPA: hypothetical protein VHB21_26215 [Minicystis sp.]|nr:hypothetical protein [Minicystis sp.]
MPKAYDAWTVLPHRPIEKLEPNLWRVEGDLPDGNGARVMTIAKLEGGGLVIHNAVALEEELMKELEAFGTPEVIVVPNGFHRLDAKVFKQRYPGAKVLCPAGARKKVEQVVPVDGTYDDAPKDANVRLYHLDGVKQHEGVMEVRSPSGTTIVLNDVVNNLPKMGGMFGFMLAPTGRVSVPRIFRWFFVKDRAAFSAGIEKLAATEGLRRVIVSHGAMLTDAPAKELRSSLEVL